MTFIDMLFSPILFGIIIRAAIVGALVSLCASLLGVTMVLRRMSTIGDGLAHAGFGALAIATLLDVTGKFTMEISIPIVMLTSFLLMWLAERGIMGGDAAIAVVSTGMITVGVLIFSFTTGYTADMCSSLFGSASVLTLTDKDLYLSIGLSAVVIVLFLLFYNRIFAVTFDENFAAATGIRARFYSMMISALTSVTVVVGLKLIGSVMISALIVFPALTAMRVCKSFRSVMLTAAFSSVLCFLFGFVMSCSLGLPVGASVVFVDLTVYIAVSATAALRQRKRQLALMR